MRQMLVSDLKALYTNFEPSKFKIIALYQNFTPLDWEVLIYLLDRLKATKKYYDEPYDQVQYYKPTELVLGNCQQLKLTRAITFSYHIKDINTSYEYINNELTIVGLLNCIKNNKPYTKTITSSNISSSVFKNLLNFVDSVYPEFMLTDRSSTTNSKPISKHEQFNIYTKFINGEYIETSNKIGRPIILKKAEIIYEKPSKFELSKFIVQPKYLGFHCTLVNNNGLIKLYNRYGELFKYLKLSDCPNNICIECILLPYENDQLFSWRASWIKKFKIVMLDIYKYQQYTYFHEPYHVRYKKLKSLENSKFTMPENVDWDQFENHYYSHIGGIVLRNKNETIIEKKNKVYNFPATQYYRFDKDFCGNLLKTSNVYEVYDGNKLVASLNELSDELRSKCKSANFIIKKNKYLNKDLIDSNSFIIDKYNIKTQIEMCEFKNVVLVYGHDEQYIYIARFNGQSLQYQHAAKLPLIDNEFFENKYQKIKIFIDGKQTNVLGVLLLRVFYTADKKIIGYETKSTSSKYDVPQLCPLYCDDCSTKMCCKNCLLL